MIAYAACVADRDKFDNICRPGLGRALAPEDMVIEAEHPRSIFAAYNEVLDAVRERHDLEALVLLHQDVDDAIKIVSERRAGLGAVQNRLEHRLNNLGAYQENLVAAESRIRDVDMASEMVNFSKLQILQQAGTAMLAQANQSSQGVLSLLR